jgi:hypothetical protein
MSDTGALTGSDVDLYFNTELIGTTVSADVDQQSQIVRVDVLGRRTSRDILRDGVSVRFTCENVYMALEDLVAAFGVVEDGEFSVEAPKVTAVVMDKVKGVEVCRVEGLVNSSFRVQIAKGRAVMTTATFEGKVLRMGRANQA